MKQYTVSSFLLYSGRNMFNNAFKFSPVDIETVKSDICECQNFVFVCVTFFTVEGRQWDQMRVMLDVTLSSFQCISLAWMKLNN